MLTTMKHILDHANRHFYGVMAINCINMEMARGAIFGAAQVDAPIIIQFGPNQIKNHAHLSEMIPLVKGLAEQVHIPVAINFDHGSKFEDMIKALQAGFTNVMYDGSGLDYDDNRKNTEIIVQMAHAKGISVEAELGHVGQAIDEDDRNPHYLTDPIQAKRFVDETNVDCLAVAIGTAHGQYPKNKVPKLDFERLQQIKKTIDIPLVLHGGSGAGVDNLRKAVKCGINKINVATDALNVAKETFIKAYENKPDADYIDLSRQTERGIRQFVQEYVEIIGSSGIYRHAHQTERMEVGNE